MLSAQTTAAQVDPLSPRDGGVRKPGRRWQRIRDRRPVILLLALASLAGGCATVTPEMTPVPDKAIVRASADARLATGLQGAFIVAIDGEPVSYRRQVFLLAPGEHTFVVWPRELVPAESLVLIPDAALVERLGLRLETLTLSVEAGFSYVLGARVLVSRKVSRIEGSETHRFAEERYIVPVLVARLEPQTLAEGAAGLGLMGAFVLVPPALIGGL